MKKNSLGFVSGLIGVLMLAIIMTVGSLFVFKYTGGNSGNISMYNYLECSSKSTPILDSETSMLEYSGNNDAYAAHLLISNERINRTEESATYSVMLVILSMVFLATLLFSFACEILSMFSYYKKRVQILTMLLRVVILAISLVLALVAPLYIKSLASGLENYFKLGISVYIFPVLALINVVLFFIFGVNNKKKGA